MTPTEAGTRPRVEGEREMEIFDATLHVLAEVGYDLLTMDAVATRATASTSAAGAGVAGAGGMVSSFPRSARR